MKGGIGREGEREKGSEEGRAGRREEEKREGGIEEEERERRVKLGGEITFF